MSSPYDYGDFFPPHYFTRNPYVNSNQRATMDRPPGNMPYGYMPNNNIISGTEIAARPSRANTYRATPAAPAQFRPLDIALAPTPTPPPQSFYRRPSLSQEPTPPSQYMRPLSSYYFRPESRLSRPLSSQSHRPTTGAFRRLSPQAFNPPPDFQRSAAPSPFDIRPAMVPLPPQGELYHCEWPRCDRVFPNRAARGSHHAWHRRELDYASYRDRHVEGGEFSCRLCGRQFSSRRASTEHMMDHMLNR